MVDILQYLANGLVFSSIIVLGSIGLSLVYSIADFANFAHGDTMTVGAYAALVSFGLTGGLGASFLGLPAGFFLALLVGMVIAAVVAVVTHRYIYKPMNLESLGLLITSIGVAFVYRATIQLGFGSDFIEFGIPAQRPIASINEAIGVAITIHEVAIVLVTAILVVALHLLLSSTTLGRKMRATADNKNLARISGIRTEQITYWMWIIGAGLAGGAGVFLGLYNQISPRMGFNVLLVIFAAVILGGIGSVYGAMLGGFLIGMINRLTPVLSDIGIDIGIEYANAIAFVIMVVVLLIRPRGIAGEGT